MYLVSLNIITELYCVILTFQFLAAGTFGSSRVWTSGWTISGRRGYSLFLRPPTSPEIIMVSALDGNLEHVAHL